MNNAVVTTITGQFNDVITIAFDETVLEGGAEHDARHAYPL